MTRLIRHKDCEHNFGYLRCGYSYPEQNIVVLGIKNNLVEFNFEKMEITKSLRIKNAVIYIEKFNNDIFLISEWHGFI